MRVHDHLEIATITWQLNATPRDSSTILLVGVEREMHTEWASSQASDVHCTVAVGLHVFVHFWNIFTNADHRLNRVTECTREDLGEFALFNPDMIYDFLRCVCQMRGIAVIIATASVNVSPSPPPTPREEGGRRPQRLSSTMFSICTRFILCSRHSLCSPSLRHNSKDVFVCIRTLATETSVMLPVVIVFPVMSAHCSCCRWCHFYFRSILPRLLRDGERVVCVDSKIWRRARAYTRPWSLEPFGGSVTTTATLLNHIWLVRHANARPRLYIKRTSKISCKWASKMVVFFFVYFFFFCILPDCDVRWLHSDQQAAVTPTPYHH